MNAQLKLLLYILMICLIFYFVQDRFDIFDIEFISDSKENTKEDSNDSVGVNTAEYFVEEGTLTIVRGDESAVIVNIEILDTKEEREKGLTGREDLADYNGMLFVFEEEGRNSFWMKNTNIALDLVFINKEKQIVEIIENAQPCEDGHICPKLTPDIEYIYCLEVNSGFVEENRIEEGDTVSWGID